MPPVGERAVSPVDGAADEEGEDERNENPAGHHHPRTRDPNCHTPYARSHGANLAGR